MRRITLLATCLATMTAFAAVSVASASAAEPALYECAKASKETVKVNGKPKSVYTGKYLAKLTGEKVCQRLAPEGKYRAEGKPEGPYEIVEWNLANKKNVAKVFKGKGKGANLEIHGVGGVACTSSTDSGKFTSPTTAGDIVATFKGCEFNSRKCSTTGQLAGTIVTNKLKGGVGYLEGKGTKTPKVGSDISAESGEILAQFKCPTANGSEWDAFEVTGSVIGEVGPVNTFSKTATFTFEEVGIGVQKWKKFEEGAEDVLTPYFCLSSCEHPFPGGDTAESAQETTVVNTGEELELKA